MTFSNQLKQEILDNKPIRQRCKTALAYGLFAFGRSFCSEEISFSTENDETVKLYSALAKDILGEKPKLEINEQKRSDRTLHTLTLPLQTQRTKLVDYFGAPDLVMQHHIMSQEQAGAFLSGAYLACGNITDPEKSYHMEFVVRDEQSGAVLLSLLNTYISGAKTLLRRQNYVIYYKECGAIEDLMTLMGATKACLALIDIEMIKNARNHANRATNCETANIDKLVGASSSQVQDIEYIIAKKGEGFLPEPLLRVAKLRIENPEASLRELSALSAEGLTRSGIHHRLDKLSSIASQLRTQGKREGQND